MSDNRRPAQPIKMSDLAKLARVSKSTVSRALANSPLIPEETRERIAELARQHNYRLNKRARSFRSTSVLTIAVLIPETREKDWRRTDPFFVQLLGSIADAVSQHGHELLLARTASLEEWVHEHVIRGVCDAVILIGQGRDGHERINELADSGVPLVVWGGRMEGQRYCTVGSDNRLGGRLATEHLLAQGCQRIAFLGDRFLPEVQLRLAGYNDALAGAGVAPDENLLVHTTFGAESGHEVFAARLAAGDRVDAVFASSDVIAMGAIRAIHEAGLRAPDDIAVVGYDDIALAAFFNPPITTIRQDLDAGGSELVKKLLQLVDGRSVRPKTLDTRLVVRHSSITDAASK